MWDDEDKRRDMVKLIEHVRRSEGTVVGLPFPPEFINVQLMDSNGVPLSAAQWPSDSSLEEVVWQYAPGDEQYTKRG